MREDMFKVIVERPRRGMRQKYARKFVPIDAEIPPNVGTTRRHVRERTRWCTKALNENLAPLQRFLGKQVGRPWSKVFSEICANLDSGHTVKQHVHDHIDDFVVTRVAFGRHGEWMVGGRNRSFGRRTAPWPQPFYVDPNDGLLKDSRKLWKKLGIKGYSRWRISRRKEPDPNVRIVDGNTELRRIDGLWFEITFAERPDAPLDRLVYDHLRQARVPAHKRHACAKRQLPKADLKRFGLENARE